MSTMARRTAVAAMAAAVCAASLGGGGALASNAKAPTVDPTQFGQHSNRVTNKWFPLKAGSRYVYVGMKDGKSARDLVRVTSKPKSITGIQAVAVKDRLYLNGRLEERTTDWYAQDRAGTVWYLGEATAELDKKGHVVSREGSFLNGRDGASGGIFMPAHPHVGDSAKQEDYPGHAEDLFTILGFGKRVHTPAVSTDKAMLVKETTVLEPGVVDHKYYVRGIGTVSEGAVKGVPANMAEHLSLASFTKG